MSNQNKKNVQILIVDDSIINQEIAGDFIEDLGFAFDTADNGQQAIEAAKENPYSLIFMDIHMPVVDGLDATRAIREHEISKQLKPVPIVALTSDTSTGIKQRCHDAGANDYLVKPFTQQEILTKIKNNLTFDYISADVIKHNSLTAENTSNKNSLLDAVEDIAQVSHWFWHITEQKIQFSTYLQHHFDFPLKNITTLEEYIDKVGSKSMDTVINECMSTEQETRWEQLITEAGSEQPKFLLHKFRYVVCEDDKPVLIGTIQDISSIRYAEQQVLQLASNDPVTGLSSRFRFNQQLEDLIRYTQRHASKFALLYLNLDTYYKINGSHEPDTGNKLLVEISNRIHTILRKSDFACRLVDDEFCIAIKDITDDHIAMKIASRYLELFDKPIVLANKNFTPEASIGLAIYPQDAAKATELIKAANTAASKAKHLSETHCSFYESATNNAAQSKLYKEKEIQDALTRNEFEMYYQPKVSLHDGSVNSLEAFIRWNHPDNSVHLPESFLSDAKDMGLMIEIGEWVIQQVCKQINQWRLQNIEDIPVSINISQQHFQQPDFVDNLLKSVSDADISPSLIEIEITESIARDQKTFNYTCRKLRLHGFTTAIDDFGTGYSSLSVLKQIPIDVLKIDNAFITNLPNDSQSSIIIGTILGISNALGLKVVAEGVESNDQLKTLIAMGCHLAQGHYFSPAVTASKIPELRKQNFRRTEIYRVA